MFINNNIQGITRQLLDPVNKDIVLLDNIELDKKSLALC